ncbi:SDR family oxidoreductase [Actinacidiphila bryophytorum]|uniref:Short-chain dehydrogenase n=1 Tax=Actinacidiphila bryophytorum TaxID=1436133 RepID=A0A9W4E3F9_9ACTN|nr:SDR family oxidoreductase [Actinacidiphila bryophytorum]MBM9435465.1 SDR family oxidoreductase [Actinacidiphila bryophytorum]MBN6545300.1 SDR family oxidoreductase [Actinacidiphila bryophytorum]CAG7608434.1 Short-chain dehydrogenase [Actinacidiphila bryophytorum]
MSGPRIHLVTGAGSGIGSVVAQRLLERGDEVWLLARDAGRARELAERHPGARTLVGDLAEPARLSWALGHQSPPDRLDSLLHVAGTVELGLVGDLTPKVWQETLAVNLMGPAELTRLLLPQLRLSRGHVVFVNSTSGLAVSGEWSAYGASKFGLRALADALRAEEHAAGVRVTSLYPSRTATPMQQKVHQQEGKPYDPARWIAPESVATTLLTALDLPRDAELTDLTVRPGQ